MLIDSGGLGFSEADEIDYVGENFDEAIMSGFEEVVEGEIVDAALLWSITLYAWAIWIRGLYLNE